MVCRASNIKNEIYIGAVHFVLTVTLRFFLFNLIFYIDLSCWTVPTSTPAQYITDFIESIVFVSFFLPFLLLGSTGLLHSVKIPPSPASHQTFSFEPYYCHYKTLHLTHPTSSTAPLWHHQPSSTHPPSCLHTTTTLPPLKHPLPPNVHHHQPASTPPPPCSASAPPPQ